MLPILLQTPDLENHHNSLQLIPINLFCYELKADVMQTHYYTLGQVDAWYKIVANT